MYNPAIKVLLLAAGSSRRFWPVADKFRLSIAGKTLLEHQMDRLRRGGCDEIICVVGQHNREWVRSLSPTVTTIVQGEEGGMRGALLAALPLCGNAPVLVVGNDLIDADAYRGLQEKFSHCPNLQGILLAREVEEYFPGGYLSLHNDRIAAICEKPEKGKEPSNLVNLIAHIHRDASLLLHALAAVPAGGDDGYEQALQALFQRHDFAALPYNGTWFPLKFPWHPLYVLPALLEGLPGHIHPSASIHASAVIEGGVAIEEGVRIFPHATVRGPCFIGKSTIVGNNALVWGSSIGRSCVVGFGTEVKASILGNNVWTHSTYVGDSVIGDNVCFGAGSVTGNFRLDEQQIFSVVGQEKIPTGRRKLGAMIGENCRVGMHVSISPGIKIGGGSFVGGAVNVARDVPEGSFVSMNEGGMVIRKNTSQIPHPHDRLRFQEEVEGKNGGTA